MAISKMMIRRMMMGKMRNSSARNQKNDGSKCGKVKSDKKK